MARIQRLTLGSQGYQGNQGHIGYQGFRGMQGYQGNLGSQGLGGSQGFKGVHGDSGFQGFIGNQGFAGSQGLIGDPGGPQGNQGDQGFQGAQGSRGYQGNQGAQGDQGYRGYQGDQGYRGYQGDQGYRGYQGDHGDQGYQGAPAATNYATLWVPAGSGIKPATLGAEIAPYELSINKENLDYAAFDSAQREFIDFNVILPENWDLGTIKAKFYWTCATTPGSGSKVEWGIKSVARGDDDALDVTYGTEQVIYDTLITVGDCHASSATPALTVGGTPQLNDYISFRVSRNIESANDDIDIDVLFLGVLIQFSTTATAIAGW